MLLYLLHFVDKFAGNRRILNPLYRDTWRSVQHGKDKHPLAQGGGTVQGKIFECWSRPRQQERHTLVGKTYDSGNIQYLGYIFDWE